MKVILLALLSALGACTYTVHNATVEEQAALESYNQYREWRAAMDTKLRLDDQGQPSMIGTVFTGIVVIFCGVCFFFLFFKVLQAIQEVRNSPGEKRTAWNVIARAMVPPEHRRLQIGTAQRGSQEADRRRTDRAGPEIIRRDQQTGDHDVNKTPVFHGVITDNILEFNSLSKKSTKTQDAACCICLDPIEQDQDARELKTCGHEFHEECLKKWIKSNFVNPSCPLCKAELPLNQQAPVSSGLFHSQPVIQAEHPASNPMFRSASPAPVQIPNPLAPSEPFQDSDEEAYPSQLPAPSNEPPSADGPPAALNEAAASLEASNSGEWSTSAAANNIQQQAQ